MRNGNLRFLLGIIALGFAVTGGGSLRAADTDDGSTTVSTAASHPTEELVEKFSAFAGSTQNAEALVNGLRNGTSITLTDSGGSSTAITPSTKPMGFGNVNIALSLARQELVQQGITQPTPAQIQAALTGGTITTSTGSVALTGILTLRGQGMGWGAIANSLGFKLGEVVRSTRAEKIGKAEKSDKADADDKSAKPERIEVGRMDKVERPERPVRPERPERAGK
ncbi:MAG: hypothetical protein HY067_03715 [Betaproteobacteria bacterium]|nr:hypothetical protein [Betaproteobacteria bacterium]